MAKKHKRDGAEKGEDYEDALRDLQIELVKVQRHVIKNGEKAVVIFEGRDGAGKDGTIKRIVEHMSPRETRVVALGKPSDRERTSWYFQRFVPHLPAAGEIVIFNRSWYNRAGVEPVMGFCTPEEQAQFLVDVLPFENMLIGSGIRLVKYYLDINKQEQKKRLADRARDPLKQWKRSPIDEAAQKRWNAYTEARDVMLARTSTPAAPWTVVRADDKRAARLNVLRDLISRLPGSKADKRLSPADPNVVFPFDDGHARAGLLAK